MSRMICMTDAEFLLKWEEYSPMAYKFIRTISDPMRANWNDLEQCGRIALFKSLRSYDVNKGASFLTWLNKSIKREVTTYLRIWENGHDNKDRKYCPVSICSLDDVTLTTQAPELPLDGAINDIMSVRMRQIWKLRDMGYSLRMIGGMLGISEGRISQIMKQEASIIKEEAKDG